MSERVSVIVIGGSHAGPAISQKLVRQTPRAAITLINPSDEYYFNNAAPRFLVKPESLPPSKYLYPIPEAFREYPAGAFTFSVSVFLSADSISTIAASFVFDYLVIASGSTTPATLGQAGVRLPFKATAFEDTRKAIYRGHETLKTAKRIVIGGAGPLGVELAGNWRKLQDRRRLRWCLGQVCCWRGPPSLFREQLYRLYGGRIRGVRSPNQTWKVKLSTGQICTADAYIATTGTIPNNQFIPKSCLNPQGWVNVDERLRVVEDSVSRTETYAVGDITCHPYRLLSRVSLQGETVASNIATAIERRARVATYSVEVQKKMMVVPVGQSTGTGHLGGWTLFGCLVWFFKGKDLFDSRGTEVLARPDAVILLDSVSVLI
ncbi:hypothetical protein N7532_008784 [Penicillium argentinense]|uniref:FAD/NAD(P)-binding domain-containing protein n=1 Tax=Penicillium argentinense TaxID=1131581 RepID=A0A9W9EYB3_9EURO|nr:uncharacterized protein N7532_008784 [Penicillium argentinense]KAJ5090100.1 hypothetical protein N7532_008784 [Penicillium argentinense]